jgi:aminodeoxyfutalosine synthase
MEGRIGSTGGSLHGEPASFLAKPRRGERFSRADGERLFACGDLLSLGRSALLAARRRHGRRIYYVRNGHLDYCNYCVNACDFCSFSRRKGDGRTGGFELGRDQILSEAERIAAAGATELHLVGGLHPERGPAFHLELLSELRRRFPRLGLKCFTAVEVRHFARQSGWSIRETLARLKAAGLDCLTGGGAELLDDAWRARHCPAKGTAAEWLAVHREAHRLGLTSNATLLYGHTETPAQRVAHLLALRELQDETGGFRAFVPLAYHPAGNRLGEELARESGAAAEVPSGMEQLRTIAVSRLLLDNFLHVTAYWVTMGPGLAQAALNYGATDLDGTVMTERIHHSAGSPVPQALSVSRLRHLIREAGGIPVERDHLYRPVGGSAKAAPRVRRKALRLQRAAGRSRS